MATHKTFEEGVKMDDHPKGEKHSSIPTPLHLISRIPVAKMERKKEINHILEMLLICGIMNLLVSRQTAGSVQYMSKGMEVIG